MAKKSTNPKPDNTQHDSPDTGGEQQVGSGPSRLSGDYLSQVKWDEFDFADMLTDDWDGPKILCNFEVGSPDGKRMVFQRNQSAEENLPDLKEGKKAVKYWLIERRDFPDDKTGERRPGLLICLWDPDIKMHTSGSVVVATAIRDLCWLYGAGPWADPIVLQFNRKKTRGGRETYRIDLVEAPE